MTIFKNKKHLIAIGGVSIVTKFLFIVFVMGGVSANAAPAPESFADLAERLLPTVVNISSTQKIEEIPQGQQQRRNPFGGMQQFPDGHPFNDFFDDFFGGQGLPPMPHQQMPASSLGSGFILDKEKGLIITNNHVIAGADEIKVTLHNEKILPATLIGTDDKTDIAVLKVDLKGEKVNDAVFGDSDKMRVGDWVLAIGNPFGLGGTVTAGIISARARDINSGPYDDYLQTDASINRGNSGGPMFNTKGEVIGINTAIFSPTGGSVGIGFAIPSVMAEPIVKQLNEFGRTKRGWLGVKIQDVSDDIAESLGLAKAGGALVAEVTPTGPAEKAGIEAGDIILAFDNQPIREMRNLPRIVAAADIEKSVPVIIWRDGKRITLSANIGELEKAEDNGLLSAHDGQNIFDDTPTQATKGAEIPELELTVNIITPALRTTYDIASSVEGLVVIESDPNGDAAKKGIDAGDVIIDINQQPVQSVDNLKSKIAAAKKAGRETVLLLVNRQGSIQFVAVKIIEPKQSGE